MPKTGTRLRSPLDDRGNAVSEWFGHRVFPTVAATSEALADQRQGRCPFLSYALREDRACVKPASSSGVCTINSASNGPRQDWLVCPYRALHRGLLEDVGRRLFGIPECQDLLLLPAPTLARPDVRDELLRVLASKGNVLIYFQDKLGGEISLPATDRSPELAFDITLARLVTAAKGLDVNHYGILEVQTMDFHGSYRHAVANLKDGLRLHGHQFPTILAQNQTWLADRVEGPNIANVFKRTFYQMMLKFQIGGHAPGTGCVLAIPQSVWDSWQRHLGKPALELQPDGTVSLHAPRQKRKVSHDRTWIYVLDVDAASGVTPNPVTIAKIIRAAPDSLSHYALTVAPEAAVTAGGSADSILPLIRRRLVAWWPDLAAPDGPVDGTGRKRRQEPLPDTPRRVRTRGS